MNYIIRILTLTFLITCHHAYSQSTIVINEIMYNQKGNDTLEFIELYNKGPVNINLNGYTFSQGVDYTFTNYTLNSGAYVVVSRYSSFVDDFFKITSLQWTNGVLDNNGEKIVLKDPSGNIVDSVEYSTSNTWDKEANGTGASIALCDPLQNNALGYNWAASNVFVGIFKSTGTPIWATPGKANIDCNAPGEIFPPKVKKVYTESTTKIKIAFDEPVSLSTSQNTANYTGIGSIASATRTSLDTVILLLATPLEIGKVDSLSIANIKDTSTAGNMLILKKEVVVFNNTIADLIISEIFYDNIGTDTLEFVEVYNKGANTAIVGGYRFTDGIDFMFPTMTIASGTYVAIPSHKTVFNLFFSKSATFDFSGSLINSGEKLTIKNTVGDVIDSLTYLPSWQPLTNPGASLVLCDLSSDNNVGKNWGASNDFAGSFMGGDVWASPGSASATCIPLGILSNSTQKVSFQVYPNPAKEIFNIQFPDTRAREVIVMDAYGKIASKENCENNFLSIKTSNLKGIYFIQVIDTEQHISETSKILFE